MRVTKPQGSNSLPLCTSRIASKRVLLIITSAIISRLSMLTFNLNWFLMRKVKETLIKS